MVDDELQKITSDFQCFVCGAIFSTEEDKRQHLKKELHGKFEEDASDDDSEAAQEQSEPTERRKQEYETTA
jgi:hypothetical protein